MSERCDILGHVEALQIESYVRGSVQTPVVEIRLQDTVNYSLKAWLNYGKPQP